MLLGPLTLRRRRAAPAIVVAYPPLQLVALHQIPLLVSADPKRSAAACCKRAGGGEGGEERADGVTCDTRMARPSSLTRSRAARLASLGRARQTVRIAAVAQREATRPVVQRAMWIKVGWVQWRRRGKEEGGSIALGCELTWQNFVKVPPAASAALCPAHC